MFLLIGLLLQATLDCCALQMGPRRSGPHHAHDYVQLWCVSAAAARIQIIGGSVDWSNYGAGVWWSSVGDGSLLLLHEGSPLAKGRIAVGSAPGAAPLRAAPHTTPCSGRPR